MMYHDAKKKTFTKKMLVTDQFRPHRGCPHSPNAARSEAPGGEQLDGCGMS